MGVAHREPPARALLVCMLLVLASGSLVKATQCERRVEASSPMFGAAWADTFFMYTQDYNWKVSGDISKVNMFYGMTEGCLKGVKAQYGPDPANAQRLGVETKALLTRSIQLKEGEHIVRAEYKASSKCIEYMSLRTNQGRQLAVGKPDSETPTSFAAPTNPNGYLGYLNGHTAKPMNSPDVGKLMQMQLVWVSNACEGDHSTPVSTAGVTAAAAAAGGHHKGASKLRAAGSSSSIKATIAAAAEAAADSNAAKCTGNHLCSGGKCATSSCMLAGIGSEVPNMLCHGTNMRLPILSSGVEMSPCSFLGCKLDTESCSSSGLMGVGGFCTGRVVATGAAAMLHPQGKQWLGYPCVEHKNPGLSLRASILGELTSGQDMMGKSWKVCDCVKKSTSRNSLAVMMPNGTIASYIFGKGDSKQQKREEPTVAVPLMSVYEMNITDVVTQWLAAKAGNAVLPTATIPSQLAADLKQLVHGFTTPSILIANTSAALITHPEWMTNVPVFVLPNSALTALKAFIPDLTSLPTLALAPNATTADVAAKLGLPKGLLVSDITVAALPALAAKLGLPTFLKLNPSTSTNKVDSRSDVGPHLVALDQMHIGSVMVQWATAASRKAPLPTLVLSSKQQLEQLQAKVPGLVTPSIIVPNISHALLFKPQSPGLPLFVLPSELSAEVMAILPDITSLPSFLVLAEQQQQDLPKLQISDFIAPNMRVLVDTLGPSIPLLLKPVSNVTGPSLNVSMAGLADNPAMQAMMSMGPWGHLMSTVSGIPDLLVDASGLDMGSIKEVVISVQEALATTGFKLPYLSMNDDTIQKWGMKKIEGFVTNVVTRATTPREDAGLINDGTADDSNTDTDAGKKGGKRKGGHANAGKASSEAHETAKGNKVAAVMSAMSDEQQESDIDAESAAAIKPRPPPKIKMITPLPNATSTQPLTPEEQRQVDNTKKNQHMRDVADDDYVEEEENITSVEQQKPKKPDTNLHSKTEPAVPKSAPDGAAAGPKPTVAQKASKDSSSSSSKAAPAAVTKDREPPAKPAYKPGVNAQAAAAAAPAAPGTVATPVPSSSVPVPAGGVPVPVISPHGAKAQAGSNRAAAPAPAPKQQQQQKPPQQQQQQPKPAATPAKPQFRAGTLDEDGAMYVDESAASRAFMSEEQWAAVAQDHKDKLLMLLAVSDT